MIVPLMQGDAVDRFHWMTDPQFLNAVALGWALAALLGAALPPG